MARIPERKFDPARPVFARRFFVAAGRHWNPGDRFDWARLSVAQRRVRQLFDAGKLMHEPVPAPAPAAPAEAPAAQDSAPIQTEVENDDILAAAAEAPEPPAPVDDLDDLDMKALRAIAEEIGAPSRVSREAQREAIRETRRGKDQ